MKLIEKIQKSHHTSLGGTWFGQRELENRENIFFSKNWTSFIEIAIKWTTNLLENNSVSLLLFFLLDLRKIDSETSELLCQKSISTNFWNSIVRNTISDMSQQSRSVRKRVIEYQRYYIDGTKRVLKNTPKIYEKFMVDQFFEIIQNKSTAPYEWGISTQNAKENSWISSCELI